MVKFPLLKKTTSNNTSMVNKVSRTDTSKNGFSQVYSRDESDIFLKIGPEERTQYQRKELEELGEFIKFKVIL